MYIEAHLKKTSNEQTRVYQWYTPVLTLMAIGLPNPPNCFLIYKQRGRKRIPDQL